MTNQKQIEKMQKKLNSLYKELPKDEKIISTVSRIVELEILLEAECNQ